MSRVLADAKPGQSRTSTTRTTQGPMPHPAPVSPADGDNASPAGKTSVLARLRRMGQALALPIAAMPAAGLLLRAGQDDLLGRFAALHDTAAVISGAGAAILDYLPLLFALGIGLGMNQSKDRAGPVIACVISYLVMARVILVLAPLPPEQANARPAQWPYGALAGIIAALLALAVWKRPGMRRLPAFAAYGIVITAAATVGTALGWAYPTVERALTASAAAVSEHAVAGGGAFGFLNRLLLPIGLHNPLNMVVWYLAGDCGDGIKGDVPCFLQAHDADAGTFMTGFFPIAMVGLPAAALAMVRSARPEQRRKVASLLLPAAGLSALAGVTEPIEMAFAFVALPLYLVHAVLTGLSLALVNALGIHSGFVFSAGGLDYLFNFSISTKPLLLIPVSLAFGAVYYAAFRFLITRFNFLTPGRVPEPAEQTNSPAAAARTEPGTPATPPQHEAEAPRMTRPPPHPSTSAPPPNDVVQAAYYGIGAMFPTVILDATPSWTQTHPSTLPERTSSAQGLLLLRWTGPAQDEPTAPATLLSAARKALPAIHTETELQTLSTELPPGVRLVVLPERCLLGPWDQRPGNASAEAAPRTA